MSHAHATAGVVLLCVALSSCAPGYKPVSMARPTRPLLAKDYPRERARWTRFDSILRELDTTVRVHAILRGPAFEAALIAQQQKLFSLDAARVTKLEDEARKRAEEGISLIMITATHELAWNDFDRKTSHWRIFLQNDAGEQLEPTKIHKKRRVTETDRTLFPQLENFYLYYDLTFPRTLPDGRPFIRDGVKALTLHVTGALGHAKLRWELR